MDDLLKMIKSYIGNANNRKFINRLLLILVITIILIIMINGLTSKEEKVYKEDNYQARKTNDSENIMDYSSYLETRLVKILKKIRDAGEVDVMITLEDTSEKIPGLNTIKSSESTEESDAEGGVRKILREEENIQLVQIGEDIVVLKEVQANIKGVIVVAEGAEDPSVLENIYEAVKTVLGINGNRVQVFPSN